MKYTYNSQQAAHNSHMYYLQIRHFVISRNQTQNNCPCKQRKQVIDCVVAWQMFQHNLQEIVFGGQ